MPFPQPASPLPRPPLRLPPPPPPAAPQSRISPRISAPRTPYPPPPYPESTSPLPNCGTRRRVAPIVVGRRVSCRFQTRRRIVAFDADMRHNVEEIPFQLCRVYERSQKSCDDVIEEDL